MPMHYITRDINFDTRSTSSIAIHKVFLIFCPHTGTFIDNGERSNIQECISACCDTPSCDVALMKGKKCFSVQCKRTNCQEGRAESSSSTSRLAYVARYAHTEQTQGRIFKDLNRDCISKLIYSETKD